ncbi:MAG: alpha/beta hydrolase [Pseudomonadota bacterium]
MSLQVTIAKLLLKLPETWLVKLAGGAPVVAGGRTLDPHFQFLAHGAKKQPPMSSMAPQDGRAASAAGLAMFMADPEPGVTWQDSSLNAPGREIPIRTYRPDHQDENAPVMVFFHFGGGVIGDLDTCHAFCTILASQVRCPVVSVDYRLAPEHKWPAGLEDCQFAYEWAMKNAESLGAPAGEAAIGGDSMGANFSAIIAQECKRSGIPAPALQLLIYPAVDVSEQAKSYETFGDAYPLSTDTMEWFMSLYLPEDADLKDLRISPAQEMNLEGLPPAIVVTAGFDPLVDEGEAYAKRLDSAGVETLYRCYDRLAHGFTAFTGVSPAADEACRDIAEMVRTAYDARGEEA